MYTGSVNKDKNTAKWSYIIEMGRGINGKRKQKRKRGFRTKKDAQKAMTKILHELNKGTYIEPKKITMESFLSEWLKNKQLTIRQSTYRKYYWIVNKHLIPHIGNVLLPDLTPTHVQQLYYKLSKEKKLSNENVKSVHKLLSQSLRQGVKFDYIPRNVTEFIELPKVEKKEVNVWNLDQVRHFLNIAKTNRYHIVYQIALNTGMRQGEILGLRWRDIEFDRKTLNVRQTLSHTGELVNATKTAASSRTIALPDQLVAELKKHKITQAEEKLKAGSLYTNNELVVATQLGTPLNPRNLVRNFYGLIKKTELNKIRFHDLRHTHASLLLIQGAHPKVVSERLGHADTRITLDTYSHLLPNMQEETAKQFGDMLFNNKEDDDYDSFVKEAIDLSYVV